MRKNPARNRRGGSRNSDPDTSKRGGVDVYPRSGSQRWMALMAIAVAGDRGATYGDVEDATKIRGVWKRISELKQGGWIETSGTRVIEETGSEGDVYILTDRAKRYLSHKEGYSFA